MAEFEHEVSAADLFVADGARAIGQDKLFFERDDSGGLVVLAWDELDDLASIARGACGEPVGSM